MGETLKLSQASAVLGPGLSLLRTSHSNSQSLSAHLHNLSPVLFPLMKRPAPPSTNPSAIPLPSPPPPSITSSASISAPHPHAQSSTTHIPPPHPAVTHPTPTASHPHPSFPLTSALLPIPPSSIPPPTPSPALDRVVQVGWWSWDLLAKPFVNGLFFGLGTHISLYVWERLFLRTKPHLPFIADVHPDRLRKGPAKAVATPTTPTQSDPALHAEALTG